MPQSYCNLLYHLVFSTKERRPWLNLVIAPDVYAYLGGIIREIGGTPLVIGGTEDHVHLLARLRQDDKVCDVLKTLKANSSGWIHKTLPSMHDFHWQNGYGAFTVSASQVPRVRRYIVGQEAHHRKQDFKTEFIALLKAHDIDYDERYLWD